MREIHLLALTLLATSAAAFVVPLPRHASKVLPARTGGQSMGLFGDAFKNDDSLGKVQNAGLKQDAAIRTVTWVGPNGQKKESKCIAGNKLRDVCAGPPIVTRIPGLNRGHYSDCPHIYTQTHGSQVARSAGIPIKYECGDGKCKTCEAMVGRGRAKIW